MKDTLILGIESSCDETAASVVKNGRTVLSNVISSQIEIHKRRRCTGNRLQKPYRKNQSGHSGSAGRGKCHPG